MDAKYRVVAVEQEEVEVSESAAVVALTPLSSYVADWELRCDCSRLQTPLLVFSFSVSFFVCTKTVVRPSWNLFVFYYVSLAA